MMTSTAASDAKTLLDLLSNPDDLKVTVQNLVDRLDAATAAEASARASVEAASNSFCSLQTAIDAHNRDKGAFEAEMHSRSVVIEKREFELMEALSEVETRKSALDEKLARLKSFMAE